MTKKAVERTTVHDKANDKRHERELNYYQSFPTTRLQLRPAGYSHPSTAPPYTNACSRSNHLPVADFAPGEFLLARPSGLVADAPLRPPTRHTLSHMDRGPAAQWRCVCV